MCVLHWDCVMFCGDIWMLMLGTLVPFLLEYNMLWKCGSDQLFSGWSRVFFPRKDWLQEATCMFTFIGCLVRPFLEYCILF